jgi:hypothetical protein
LINGLNKVVVLPVSWRFLFEQFATLQVVVEIPLGDCSEIGLMNVQKF